MEKIESLSSEDIVAQNIEKLRQLFPTAFSEGRLITEELLAILGEYTEKEVEYYHMDWAGKTRARMEANKVSTGTLRPAPEESKHWEDTGNIFIEGDNLEVLKLLQKSYSNKVKMIYIDPPYNTGKDFVYKDNYHDNLKNYLELSGQADETGRKLSTNTESDGRYHSNWLNMMYPRLMLARNLLTEDGVIFISIDDNEQANLKKLCDEIFGEENFVGVISWLKKRKGSFLSKKIISVTEYIFLYSKHSDNVKLFGGKPDKSESQPLIKRTNPQGILTFPPNTIKTKLHNGIYEKGFYGTGSSRVRLLEDIKVENNLIITSSSFEGPFVWSQKLVDTQINLGAKFIINTNNFQIRVHKIYGEESFKGLSSFINGVELKATNEDGYEELKAILKKEKILDYPKPTSLIKYLTNSITYFNKNSLIMDFFAGSGTTAHAVMALNAEDGGNRKCISIQLPEPTEEKSEAYKAGYSTIAEIAKERIRRAGELILTGEEEKTEKLKEQMEKMIGRAILQITESDSIDATRYRLPEGIIIDEAAEDLLDELNEADTRIRSLDTGFRVFKLDASNLHSWDPATDKFETQLDELFATGADHIKSDRTESDLLYEILLKFGLELTIPILEKTLHGQTIYNIGFGTLYICLGENIHVDIARGIGEWQKEFPDSEPTVIFRDSGFPDDAAKTNTVQMLKQYGIDKVSSI